MSKSVISGITPLTKQPFYVVDLKSGDEWNNAKGELRMREIVQAFIYLGYKGIGFNQVAMRDDQIFCHFEYRSRTPEGKIVASIMAMVQNGKLPRTVSQYIKELKEEYIYWGFPLPGAHIKYMGEQ